ncbi:MAG: DUF5131 family protein [Betaproteobacteria bacterium]
MGAQNATATGFKPSLHDDLSTLRSARKKPRVIFVNSISDLFQEAVPDDFIRRVFATMEECPQHTFQILTRRSDRLREFGASLPWPRNLWMGVSVEDMRVIDRVTELAAVPAQVRFLSCEPLSGRCLTFRCRGFIGHRRRRIRPPARPTQSESVESIYS